MLLSSADSLSQDRIVGNSCKHLSLPQPFINVILLAQSHPSGFGMNQVIIVCSVVPGPSLDSFIPARDNTTSLTSLGRLHLLQALQSSGVVKHSLSANQLANSH